MPLQSLINEMVGSNSENIVANIDPKQTFLSASERGVNVLHYHTLVVFAFAICI
jgi:hypothetical protein